MGVHTMFKTSSEDLRMRLNKGQRSWLESLSLVRTVIAYRSVNFLATVASLPRLWLLATRMMQASRASVMIKRPSKTHSGVSPYIYRCLTLGRRHLTPAHLYSSHTWVTKSSISAQSTSGCSTAAKCPPYSVKSVSDSLSSSRLLLVRDSPYRGASRTPSSQSPPPMRQVSEPALVETS
jgi:hypothetical protein